MSRLGLLTKITAAFAISGVHLAGAAKVRAGQLAGFVKRQQAPRIYAVKKLRSIPHVDKPWTQGLEMSPEGYLVESVGAYPPSTNSYVRTLDTSTGQMVHATPKVTVFLEGIAKFGNRWFASTYNDHEVLEYDDLFNVVQKHNYPYEGWGLVHVPSGDAFLATNGTASLFSLDRNFQLLGEKMVTCLGKPVPGMNELEFVENFGGHGPAVLGNLMNTRLGLAVDPDTAACTAVFHLTGLERETSNEPSGYHVANGIAHDKNTGNFWVTGKNWDEMFEISMEEQEAGQDDALSLLRLHLRAPARGGALLQVPVENESE